MDPRFSAETVVVAAKDQVSCNLGPEAALLNVKNGVYYGLDPMGAEIWKLLQKPQRVSEISQAILREYDVQREVLERDLVSLLERLHAEGLIEVQAAP